jgi:hypothetical protein
MDASELARFKSAVNQLFVDMLTNDEVVRPFLCCSASSSPLSLHIYIYTFPLQEKHVECCSDFPAMLTKMKRNVMESAAAGVEPTFNGSTAYVTLHPPLQTWGLSFAHPLLSPFSLLPSLQA